jgi:hypothetical protein
MSLAAIQTVRYMPVLLPVRAELPLEGRCVVKQPYVLKLINA